MKKLRIKRPTRSWASMYYLQPNGLQLSVETVLGTRPWTLNFFRHLHPLICFVRNAAVEAAEVERYITFPLRPPIFGGSLEDIMSHQKDKPTITLPLVVTSLVNLLTTLRAQLVEGIFRIPGNIPQVTKMRLQIEGHNYTFQETDPHIPASALKVFLSLN